MVNDLLTACQMALEYRAWMLIIIHRLDLEREARRTDGIPEYPEDRYTAYVYDWCTRANKRGWVTN